jgi:hypothetical protein
MVDLDTFRRVADSFEKPDRSQYRHYFNGVNYLLYLLGEARARRAGDGAAGFRLQYQMAVERLRSCAEMELSPVYQGGRLAEVRVRVHNRRAGHSMPTHLTNIRQVWLEVTATDANGQVLMASGLVDDRGRIGEGARSFGTEGRDEDFLPAVDPWKVRSMTRDDTVPARGYRDAHYGVPAPSDGGPVTVKARLRYRQASPDLVQEILASLPPDIDLESEYGLTGVPELPVVDMAVAEEVFAGRFQSGSGSSGLGARDDQPTRGK